VTQISVSESLKYLCDTDETCAQAKASMKYHEHKLKSVKSLSYLQADAILKSRGAPSTQKDKEAEAYSGKDYTEALSAYHDSIAEFETMNNKRKTAELTIEVWRTQNANKRKGNV